MLTAERPDAVVVAVPPAMTCRIASLVLERGIRVLIEKPPGMTTAELLGNAALGIAALVAIWGVLQTLGLDVMTWIRGQLRV